VEDSRAESETAESEGDSAVTSVELARRSVGQAVGSIWHWSSSTAWRERFEVTSIDSKPGERHRQRWGGRSESSSDG
jgi:hypothetical protein